MSYRSTGLVLFMALCAGSSPAPAADWSPDTARILGDPSFLPVAGEVDGNFSYTYSANLYDGINSNILAGGGSYDRSENAFLPMLRYGVTDDISIFANLGWGNAHTVEQATYSRFVFGPPFQQVTEHARFSFHSLGADDPVFGATWRVIDQRVAPVSVDLTGSYSPDIFQSRAAQQRQTGTFASGGQSGTVQLAVSRETQVLTLRAYGGFGYDGRRNEVSDDGTADLRSAAHPVYTAGLQSEARLLPWLAINAGVTASRSVQFDRPLLAQDGVTPETIKPGVSVSPYAGLLVPLIDQHLVGEVQYQHDFIENQKIDLPFGQTLHDTKQESNLFTARVLFAFGGAPAAMPAPSPGQAVPTASPVPEPAQIYLVFFDWDRADLTDRARQIVAQAAQASTHVQTTRIEVNGYTDLSGGAAYNQRLSVRRAQSVKAELLRDGVAGSAIGIRGFGESNPLIPTAIGVREPQNRRVEIVIR